MPEMITERLPDSDVISGSNRIVDLIALLQAKLEEIPEEFRSVATVEVNAYDWEDSYIEYERPITEAETAERLARIDARRQRAAETKDRREVEEWIRNIRIYAGIMDRDEAMNFLQTDTEANNYHPSVYRTGQHGHA